MLIRPLHGVLPLLLAALLVAAACSGNDADKSASADATDTVPGDGAGGCGPDGTVCDDGDQCTAWDQCLAGACQGEPYSCEELECTAYTCDGTGGCMEGEVLDGWCFVTDECLSAGESLPGDPCLICAPEKSQSQLAASDTGIACQDNNICTENDFCDNGKCLAGSPPTCADGIQCTVDICDPETGCHHEIDNEMCDDDNPCTADACDPEGSGDQLGCTNYPDDTLICSDKNVCTTNDHCDGGYCESDPEPLDCNDSNTCTDELCHESYGCLYIFNDNECDDGASCTKNDACSFGKCIGEENWNSCPACDLTFSDQVAKIIKLRVGDGGYPGEALNIDNDLKTCSPDGQCELGLDNSLMLAGEFIDETIKENLSSTETELVFLAEMVDPFNGGEFTLNIYYGGLSFDDQDCDYMTQTCTYQVSSLSLTPLCDPQVAFDNVILEDGVIKGGGSGYIFPFKATFNNGESTETVLYAAKLEAQVILDDDGNVLTLKGVFGGAITKENLIALIEAIPEEYMPVDPEMIVAMVEAIPQDIDLNGDGVKDASSIALVFETIPGILEPYYK